MRLAPKWQGSWGLGGGLGLATGRVDTVCVGGDLVDVHRLGRGAPLVIVPGLAGGWRLVWPLARELARDFEVYVYELRGDRGSWALGGEEAGLNWAMGDHAEDLAALIDQLGLSSPSVLGISFGGAIALEFAARHPHALGALVVHGAEARFHPSLGSKIARRALERFPLPNDSRFINQFFNLLYGGKPRPGPLVDFVAERIWETGQGVMARRLAELESFDVTGSLSNIDVPTLVVAGERDAIVPAARQRLLAEGIPGARFETVSGAGHVGFLTHRAEVARDVRRHLRHVGVLV